MLNLYQSQVAFSSDTARYVADPYALALECVIASNALVDSILQADNAAKLASGWNGSGTAPSAYYAVLWDRTRALTNRVMQKATVVLASLWYTAWVDAGLTTADVPAIAGSLPELISLEQNYPNPFNPSTVIVGEWTSTAAVHLSVFDLLGREVAVLADGRYPAGKNRFTFNGTSLPSGVYFARLRVGEQVAVRKMVLAK
jgi:hypothetical protein